MTNSNFTVRSIFDSAWEFFKEHYEYLLPFSLIYFLIQSPTFFIDNPLVSIPFALILLPLSISIPYYADRILKGDEKRFSMLFDTVKFFFKLLAINILKILIFLLLFLPFLFFFSKNFIDMEALKGLDMININEKINEAVIKSPDLLKDMNYKAFFGITGITFLLALLVSPLLTFPEYYAVLGGHGIIDSFSLSIKNVLDNYGKVLLILIVSTLLMLPAIFFTCGIGLIFVFPLLFLVYYFTYRNISSK